MYKLILCPIDGSDAAEAGLTEAIRIAQCEKGTIRLLNVLDVLYLQSTGYMVGDLYEQLRNSGLQLLENAQVKVAAAGIAVESKLIDANTLHVADAIVEECRSWSADVIVMGTHGRRGINHLLLGSDAETVIRLSPVPVLLVKSK